ncbi:MAG: autotransporter outer membrane beta-barrel domain-containing protein, partial [Fusobacteriaceae bacterium]
NLFGVDFYPAYQNLIYDLTAYNSKLIFDNYSNLDYEKQGMNPIIGVETKSFNYDGVENKAQGYKGSQNAVFFGFDSYGTKNFRYGALGLFNNNNATFENDAKLSNSLMFQGNIYFAYKLEASKVDFFVSPYAGVYNGKIDRNVNNNSVETTSNGNYFGSLARVNRNFDLGFMYILPEVQFDYKMNNQNKIEETGNVSVNFETNSTTKANLLGAVKFGKIFAFEKDWKLDTSLRADISQEFGNPIGDVTVKVTGADVGSYTINNYTKIGSEVNGIARIALSKPFFSVYTEYAYTLSSDRTTGGTITSGLQYKFNY